VDIPPSEGDWFIVCRCLKVQQGRELRLRQIAPMPDQLSQVGGLGSTSGVEGISVVEPPPVRWERSDELEQIQTGS